MAQGSKAAGRYARALFDWCHADAAYPEVVAGMQSLRRLLAAAPELPAFLGNYLLPRAARERTLAQLFAGHLPPALYRFVRYLEAKRRLRLLDEIAARFLDLNDARAGLLRGRLASAFELAPALRTALAARLSDRAHARVELAFGVEPALLGGFKIYLRDMVYDGSLTAQLRLAHRQLAGTDRAHGSNVHVG